MSDDRWIDIFADIESAASHFRNSVTLFRMGGFNGESIEVYRNQMAFMHAMSSGYTSLEAGLERIMELVGEDKPTGSDYHAAILRRISKPIPNKRPAVIPDVSLWKAIDEARRFRHVARKSYDSLDIERAKPAAEAAEVIFRQIKNAISEFREMIDQ
jgi:hypothetical protein